MSGVLGVWHLDEQPVEAVAFEGSLARLAHRGPDKSGIWRLGPVAVGCCLSRTTPESIEEHQPLADGTTVCVFDGRLDNREELAEMLRDHHLYSPAAPDSHFALAAYDRFGSDFVLRLEGDFALCVFDGRARRMILARDRLGVRPLCYALTAKAFLLASDAKAILAYPGIEAAADEEMLADFILYFPSFAARERTFFRGIRSLPPGHLAIFEENRLTVRAYFDFDGLHPVRLNSFRDYAHAFSTLFERAVRRRLRSRSPVAISVSGGLDSSYIFCLADRMAESSTASVLGLNYGGSPGTPSDEREFILALGRACRSPIEHVEPMPGFVKTAGDYAWHTESPGIEGLGLTHRALMDRAHERGSRVMLTGHWGDQLLVSWDYLSDLIRGGRWKLLAAHLRAWNFPASTIARNFVRDQAERYSPEPLLALIRRLRTRFEGRLTAPWFTARFRSLMAERLAAGRLPRIAGSAHAWSAYQQCRLSYQIHCIEWNSRAMSQRGIEVAFPFLDRDIVQFLINIPGEIQSYGGISRNLMREAMRGVVPDIIVDRRTKGAFTHLGNASIERDFERIRSLLGPGALAVEMGYFDGPVLWKLLDAWRAENQRSTESVVAWRIVDLCGFEVFLRTFFGGATRPELQ